MPWTAGQGPFGIVGLMKSLVSHAVFFGEVGLSVLMKL